MFSKDQKLWCIRGNSITSCKFVGVPQDIGVLYIAKGFISVSDISWGGIHGKVS